MPKFILVTELSQTDEDNVYEQATSFWLNSEQIFRIYDAEFEVALLGNVEGSIITFINESARLSVLESSEQIVAVIEGRSDPAAPVK
ncbi:hypothetical protein ELI30_09400 [Rhizobium leguminosarum]|uniref:hypothetical protein n=1 Tax=Rhizobium leguminosarum TaxID=384 RepID=UPI0010302B54|nr:hypothetical protein [Rhizobium leguminosarum]TAV48499.1 hypothetical protein ELI32_09855 [Rhizobium leguminosarum]TAV57999.1 hypothetical protein ELI31_09385 [Rhizobium leguminosarum]TAV68940.1 hypothetical protein ELI30_09400 [Rhizobium leguminosarum]